MARAWTTWGIAFLVLVDAGWMVLDGALALATGTYVGETLGPWATLVSAIGVDPLSTGMKVFFVAFGALWLSLTGAYLARRRGSWEALGAVTVAGLWFLPVGTLLSLAIGVLLVVERRRGLAPGRGPMPR